MSVFCIGMLYAVLRRRASMVWRYTSMILMWTGLRCTSSVSIW